MSRAPGLGSRRTSLLVLSRGVIVFTVLAVASGAFIYSIVTNAAIRDERTYAAVFRDVSGLRNGSDVQVGGITVGQVQDLELRDDGQVEVRFSLEDSIPISTTSTAAVRYKDLLGRRVLEVRRGEEDGERLEAGATLPVEQTSPALDLDQLYNGFGPLFEGLDAEKLNELSGSLVQVLEGQGGNVEQILDHAGSLTDTVAERDEVIGALVTNLESTLQTVEDRVPETNQLVVRLQTLVSGLDADRASIGRALEGVAGSTTSITRLIAEIRPDVRADLREVERLAKVVNADSKDLDTYLKRLPGYHALVGRVGIYQSAFQFYLCGVQVRFQAAKGATVMTEMMHSQEDRCLP
jgi:phospholipid/cholesterol/gamma-HCH transport system substrate-binding protein